MKKLILILLILLTLSACQQITDPLNTLETENIYSESDGFMYNDFKWGMSLAEVEKLSGLESYVVEAPTSRDGVGAWVYVNRQPPMKNYFTSIDNVTMFARDVVKWSVVITINDEDDELIAINFGIIYPEEKAEELWEFYDEVLEMLTQELGEPDEIIEGKYPKSTSARWSHVVDGEVQSRLDFTVTDDSTTEPHTTSVAVMVHRWPWPELTEND